MKKLTLAIIAMFAMLFLALGFTGCATTPGGTEPRVTVEDITPAIKTAAFVGTFYTLRENPDWREGFVTAATDLKILENAEQLDFALILAIVARLPVDELKSDDAALAITAATILLSGYQNKLIELDKFQNVKPIARAIREGIELAL